jgi:hypothetical protein
MMPEASGDQQDNELDLHPEIWQRGEQRFVMIPYDEYIAIQEALEDARDLRTLRAARHEDDNSPGVPLASVLKELGLNS